MRNGKIPSVIVINSSLFPFGLFGIMQASQPFFFSSFCFSHNVFDIVSLMNFFLLATNEHHKESKTNYNVVQSTTHRATPTDAKRYESQGNWANKTKKKIV